MYVLTSEAPPPPHKYTCMCGGGLNGRRENLRLAEFSTISCVMLKKFHHPIPDAYGMCILVHVLNRF